MAKPRWSWDARAAAELREARLNCRNGSALIGEVAAALEDVRAGATSRTFICGRIIVLPVHTEPPCCVLLAPHGADLLIGLHFVRCAADSLPPAAFEVAESRLDHPAVAHR